MHRAVFLDKDGTLITDVPYNVNPSLVKLEKGVLDGLKALQSCGYLLVIVSNQPGISMGLFSESDLEKLIAHMTNLFAENKIDIAGFYYCPHYPANTDVKSIPDCTCRKPAPGLLTRAARDLDIDLTESWMVGDILNDVEAGSRAGCRTVMINNGNETEWEINSNRIPDYLADDFLDASNYIFIKTTIRNG
jgi:D-glycero-D-manno-heptose 1,7-bisphosphate phosphatase